MNDTIDPNTIGQTCREDGTTTKQIKASPMGAIYVSSCLGYTKRLAHDLGRDDLKIEPISFLTAYRFRGLRGSQIVIDHHVRDVMIARGDIEVFDIMKAMQP